MEENNPIPVMMPQADWVLLSRYSKDWLGRDITNDLTKDNMDKKDPASWLSIIPMDGEPRKTLNKLSEEVGLLQHSFITFMVLTSRVTLKELQLRGTLSISYQIAKDDDLVIVLCSGTILQWHNTLRSLCRREVSYELRLIANRVIGVLQSSTGMAKMFQVWKRVQLPDGTFTVR